MGLLEKAEQYILEMVAVLDEDESANLCVCHEGNKVKMTTQAQAEQENATSLYTSQELLEEYCDVKTARVTLGERMAVVEEELNYYYYEGMEENYNKLECVFNLKKVIDF